MFIAVFLFIAWGLLALAGVVDISRLNRRELEDLKKDR